MSFTLFPPRDAVEVGLAGECFFEIVADWAELRG